MWRWCLGLLLLAWCGCAKAPAQPSAPRRPEPERPRAETAAPLSLAAPGPVETSYPDAETEPPEDDVEALEAPAAEAPAARPHPLDGWSESQIEHALEKSPAALGSITLGRPGAGALFNAVRMPEGEGWVLVDPKHAWGTHETVEFIERALRTVRARYPGSHPVYIGHISAQNGGHLRPHVSHQAGRDVDLSYFHNDDSARWYRRATAGNLDLARSWELVRALVVETDVEMILIDHSLQNLLREHALATGEDPGWVKSLFDGVPGKQRPLILHARGHATHLHVRFYNPRAQETARRAHEALVRRGLVGAPTAFVLHKVKPGETLGMLAKKYGTTVRDIQRANGLRRSVIRARQTYRIPRKGKLGGPLPVLIPPRRLPPETAQRDDGARSL